MDLKEKQGREEMIESAKQVLMNLSEADFFCDFLTIAKHLKEIPEDFDLSRSVKDIISGLKDNEHCSAYIRGFEDNMYQAGNDSSVYNEWTLDELGSNIKAAMNSLAKTILGTNHADDEDVRLLVDRLKSEDGKDTENKQLAESMQNVADAINHASGSVAILAKKINSED